MPEARSEYGRISVAEGKRRRQSMTRAHRSAKGRLTVRVGERSPGNVVGTVCRAEICQSCPLSLHRQHGRRRTGQEDEGDRSEAEVLLAGLRESGRHGEESGEGNEHSSGRDLPERAAADAFRETGTDQGSDQVEDLEADVETGLLDGAGDTGEDEDRGQAVREDGWRKAQDVSCGRGPSRRWGRRAHRFRVPACRFRRRGG